jgi:exodeoxyribonuclease VII small subunit
MSKAAKNAAPPASGGAELPFEEAMKRLESVVEAMESDELPLETMLARFEEGMKLADGCQARLAAAEVKLQQLEKNAGGELTLRPPTAPEQSLDE